MGGLIFDISSPSTRAAIKQRVDRAAEGTEVEFREPTRSTAQNRLMWKRLSLVAVARPESYAWPKEVWKDGFMSALGYEIGQQYPGLEGAPPFRSGGRTSKLSVEQMTELLDFIDAYAARQGVPLLGLPELQTA